MAGTLGGIQPLHTCNYAHGFILETLGILSLGLTSHILHNSPHRTPRSWPLTPMDRMRARSLPSVSWWAVTMLATIIRRQSRKYSSHTLAWQKFSTSESTTQATRPHTRTQRSTHARRSKLAR